MTLAESAYPLRRLGRGREAAQRIDAALSLLAETHNLPAAEINLDSAACAVLRAQADHLDAMGDPAAAAAIYRDLIAKVQRAGPSPDQDLRDATALSRLYRAASVLNARIGDASQAAALESARVAWWQHWAQKLPGSAFVRRQLSEGH